MGKKEGIQPKKKRYDEYQQSVVGKKEGTQPKKKRYGDSREGQGAAGEKEEI